MLIIYYFDLSSYPSEVFDEKWMTDITVFVDI